ncbi:hypothetical protein [Alcanivorax hongdengensis]|uniref:hypothetical protein n=1 Tax=Alcanivorax hongdengensis TaxID=519051 RepID=UPI0002F64549|nr:hypothetical protein [Alcanivorax hongdengensis]
MATISINKNPTPIQIEEFAGQVKSRDKELRIPSSLKERGMLGVEGLLIQLITTWIRNTPDPTLHTHATDELSFGNLCDQLYGIYALAASNNILDQNRKKVPKKDALKKAAVSIEKIRNQDFISAFKGHYTAIPSIRAPGTQSELDNPFYNNSEIASLIRFETTIRKALYTILPKSIFKQVDPNFFSAISNVVRELFGNTHSYARSKENGDLFTTNIRAVTLCFHRIHKENLSSIYYETSMQGVLSTIEWMEDKDLIPFLDITVVDGGPGFSGSWLKKSRDEISIDEEKSAVVECFKKHGTSSANPSKGYGLTNVMREVRRLRGRMQVTTGRVQLEKGFFLGKGNLDFTKEDCRELRAPLEGTSISISLPFLK